MFSNSNDKSGTGGFFFLFQPRPADFKPAGLTDYLLDYLRTAFVWVLAMAALFACGAALAWTAAYKQRFHREPTFAEFVQGVRGAAAQSPEQTADTLRGIWHRWQHKQEDGQ